MCVKVLSYADFSPFHVVEEVLGDFVYVQNLISGEGEVEAAAQSHFPQLLGGLICIQAGMAQHKANWNEHSIFECNIYFNVCNQIQRFWLKRTIKFNVKPVRHQWQLSFVNSVYAVTS